MTTYGDSNNPNTKATIFSGELHGGHVCVVEVEGHPTHEHIEFNNLDSAKDYCEAHCGPLTWETF